MMRKILSTIVFCSCAVLATAQAAKGLKALEAKDYSGAKSAFEAALAADPNDAAAHFGLSRYYGIPATGERDNEKALASLEAAEGIFNTADEKEKAKLEKAGVTAAELTARRDRVEAAFLEDAKTRNTIADYDAFLARFPNSSVARPATNYRNTLAFQAAQQVGTEAAYNEFLAKYPDSDQAAEATKTRNQVAADVALKANTVAGYVTFIQNYPTALQAPQMQQRLYAVAFEAAKATNTVAAFEAYIQAYPESIFLQQARERLDYLKANVND